ncbi:FmdB family zinc ribbon protein [Chloroflexota bacterium]
MTSNYECHNCGYWFEKPQSLSFDDNINCPICGSPDVARLDISDDKLKLLRTWAIFGPS